jgi:hypothetical protein
MQVALQLGGAPPAAFNDGPFPDPYGRRDCYDEYAYRRH